MEKVAIMVPEGWVHPLQPDGQPYPLKMGSIKNTKEQWLWNKAQWLLGLYPDNLSATPEPGLAGFIAAEGPEPEVMVTHFPDWYKTRLVFYMIYGRTNLHGTFSYVPCSTRLHHSESLAWDEDYRQKVKVNVSPTSINLYPDVATASVTGRLEPVLANQEYIPVRNSATTATPLVLYI